MLPAKLYQSVDVQLGVLVVKAAQEVTLLLSGYMGVTNNGFMMS
jgi:hypothetical protein